MIERIVKINGFQRDNRPIIEIGEEVIRCQDCKFNSSKDYVDCEVIRGLYGRTTDNYCSLAQRKE